MKRTIGISSLFACFLLTTVELFAQFPPRVEDHFWRRKIVNKIDLTEKVNQPLVMKESELYRQYNQGVEKKGMVVALMEGLKAGKYIAYDSDSLDKPMTYEQTMALFDEARGKTKKDTEMESGGSDFDDFGGGGDDAGDGGGGDDWSFGDEFGMEEAPAEDAAKPSGDISFSQGDEFAPLENFLLFVEDRIFDKNKSVMVYDIQYIQLWYQDPGGVLRDRAICTFKYKDVMEALETTQWKNKFNDAEYRNLREIFELRLFNSYIINVSNIHYGVQTLEEAEYRKQQLINFEHELWSY
jgi:hypothetical protein